MVTVSKIIVEV